MYHLVGSAQGEGDAAAWYKVPIEPDELVGCRNLVWLSPVKLIEVNAGSLACVQPCLGYRPSVSDLMQAYLGLALARELIAAGLAR